MQPALALVLVGCITQIHAGVYTDRFNQQYQKLHGSGYFSPEGVPYHSIETLLVEAPDHGHETTSEAFSYYIWLEAMHGAISGDFSSYVTAWQKTEDYIIPKFQPTNSFYKAQSPATFIPEQDNPSDYPSQIDPSVTSGQDPIHDELVNAYGSQDIYGMHWLLDVDDTYGFGNVQGQCGGGHGPSFINTFQRGAMESVWRTIPQPCCDDFKYGGQNGFLDLFTKDNGYAKQWKYTNAPDADARAVQATYWAEVWAQQKGQTGAVQGTFEKAAKMGDYLRYSLFDKYFKQIGNCVDPHSCAPGSGKNSAHYLLSWYYAWGGAVDTNGGWAWRIGDSTAHFGYQNPFAAWVLANDQNIRPKGATATQDWATSLSRQLEFYSWLQTPEGAIAGGATNSVKGRYAQPDADVTQNTFHGMFYDWEPVYHDPPSNRWYGMQAWSMDRLAQYYYVTGDNQAKTILDKWVQWAASQVSFNGNGYQLPDQLTWSGAPPNVHVQVSKYGNDVGTAAATARTFTYYAAKAGNSTVKDLAKKLLDGIWQFQTSFGVSVEESREDYKQFNEPVYVPQGWTGKYPYGDVIDSSATFIKIRSWYQRDPLWNKVQSYLNGGPVFSTTYHRFWSQSEVALAMGAYGLLFNE